MEEAERLVALSAQILEDAKIRAEATLEEARLAAEHKVRDAARQIRRSADSLMEAAEREAEMEARRKLTATDLEAKRALLEKREKMIDDAFDAAAERLSKVSDLAVLSRLISEAAVALGGGDLFVQATERDRRLLTPAFLKKVAEGISASANLVVSLKLAEEAAPILGGVIVARSDRRIVYDNSFEERLRRAKAAIRGDVYRTLVGLEWQKS